jgi:multicomponent K+:H+ antiporter subunit A
MTTAATLLALVALPFVGALVCAALGRASRNVVTACAALVPTAGLAGLATLAPAVFRRDAPVARVPWMPEADIDLLLRMDGLAMLFAGLIFAIGLLVIVYARYYLSDTDPFARFHGWLLAFMGAMVGIALSDHLIVLVVFWEATSLTSFMLIGTQHHRPDARSGARMALAVTGAGGLALLAGVLLLGHIVGSYEITRVIRAGDTIRAHPWYGPTLALVLVGAFTKSAQVPFHFWLPNAMAAPTPVSAYLHSATMVKAGIFLLARLYPALSGTDAWFWAVGGAGLVTLAFGAYEALFRHDLKGLLAYSTISHLGLITLLLGLGSPLAAVAAVFHIVNHATFKASLFMAAGIIDHETGTRDMRRLAGLWRWMPVTGALAIVASAAMAGVPLLNGFLSKEMFFGETLALAGRGPAEYAVPVIATFAAAFSVAYSVRFAHDVFFNGEPRGLDRVPHEPPRFMRVPVELLVVLCIAIGIAPGLTIAPLLVVASEAVIGAPPPAFSLAIWHGFNLPFVMSAIALGGGVLIYRTLRHSGRLHAHVSGAWTGHRVYEGLLAAAEKGARRFTHATADGRLRPQLLWLFAVIAAAAGAPFAVAWRGGTLDGPHVAHYTVPSVAATVVAALAIAATFATTWLHRRRLVALVIVGAVGLVVALAFAVLSAPDLALTQLVVEVATVILMLLALAFLPQTTPRETPRGRQLHDAGIAVGVGVALAWATWWMTTRGGTSVSAEHIARSAPEGGGNNIVNVILVDFRGFDTYGEITVLAIAALGIAALLGLAPRRDADPVAATAPPVMLSLLVRALLPLALVVAGYLYLRGHQLPGGGFVAGLVSGVVVVMLYVAHDTRWVAARLVLRPERLIAAGLALAAITGLAALAGNAPFLTSAHGHVQLPLLGDLHFASAAAFDAGVWLVVVGVVLLILEQLGRAVPPPAAEH